MRTSPIGLAFVIGALVGGVVVIAGFIVGREHGRRPDYSSPAIVDDGARALKRTHVYEITCAGGGEPVRDGVAP